MMPSRVRFFLAHFFLLVSLGLAGSAFAGTAFGGVDVSTATGDSIQFDSSSGMATVKGHAAVASSTGTLEADQITINTKSKEGHAVGNVVLHQSSATLTGTEGDYDWNTSTGVLKDGKGVSPPWRFSGREVIQTSPDVFRLKDGSFTSCDMDPPHYKLRYSRSRFIKGDRINSKDTRLVIDETPVLFTPFYTRSLVPKKYEFRIEPGQSSRDGLRLLTTFGYPYTVHSYTRLSWDWRENTGNGGTLDHRYNIPGVVDGTLVMDYFRDTNPDPQPQEKRYKVQWGHYQKLTPKLTTRAHFFFQSDSKYGSDFDQQNLQGLVQNNNRPMQSQGEFTYQFLKSTLLAQFERDDLFDSSVSSHSFVSQLIAPKIVFNTIPLKFRFFPFYTNVSANYINQTQTRTSPQTALVYQPSANSSVQISRDFRSSWLGTLTPRFSFDETWQRNVQISTMMPGDIYSGRYGTGVALRRKMTRTSDVTLNYDYRVRFKNNRTDFDGVADDHGVESNVFAGTFLTRIGRNTRFQLSSGADLRAAPKSDPLRYNSKNERITPPALDMQWQASRRVSVFFRETYSVFDTATKRIVRTPLNTAGEIQMGDVSKATFFSQGFSFTKGAPTELSALTMSNRLKFFLTPHWYLDFNLTYRLLADHGMQYRSWAPTSKSLTVARDLHCWLLRMQFSGITSGSTTKTEAMFYIDLKTNVMSSNNVFNQNKDQPLLPTPGPAGPKAPPAPAPQTAP